VYYMQVTKLPTAKSEASAFQSAQVALYVSYLGLANTTYTNNYYSYVLLKFETDHNTVSFKYSNTLTFNNRHYKSGFFGLSIKSKL